FLFKKGKITPGVFHANLAMSAKRYGLDPSEYADLILYTRYALEYESIDLLAVFGELADLNAVIFSQMNVTPEQKEFWELEKSVRIFSHFLEAKISSPDKKYYTENTAKFDTKYLQRITDHLSKEYGVEAADIDWKLLNGSLSNSVQFYRDVEARDAALLSNLTQRMIQKNIKVACLVAGGFHSEGLSNLMSQGKISHMVVMPSFDSKEGERPYLTVITDKGSFLEQKLRTEAQLEAMSLLMASAVNSGINLRNVLPQYAQSFWEESSKQAEAGNDWEAYLNTKTFNLKEGVSFQIAVEKNNPRIISSAKLSEQDTRQILDEREYAGNADLEYGLAKDQKQPQDVLQTIR
ncbi:MAG: hypothetical protein KC649_08205, partial [Candidatus Omnitrophica bacterium]|nr:hypothetical protein [Candidatus Omnitrophota bacterium]